MNSPLNTAQQHFDQAFAFYHKGLLDEAINSYRTAIDMRGGNFPRAYYHLAYALLDAGDTNGAIDSFRKAIEQQPDNPDAYFNLGLTLARTGDSQR